MIFSVYSEDLRYNNICFVYVWMEIEEIHSRVWCIFRYECSIMKRNTGYIAFEWRLVLTSFILLFGIVFKLCNFLETPISIWFLSNTLRTRFLILNSRWNINLLAAFEHLFLLHLSIQPKCNYSLEEENIATFKKKRQYYFIVPTFPAKRNLPCMFNPLKF